MLNNSANTRIKKLSPLLINQLAAGEVVTRPAAVVKELLENAIDAGATHIEVRITQGGMGRIEVVDNGDGIHPDDMVMAITRHATSKVADIANLHGITTLGFRGEALAATAAVSRLTLISSHNDSGIGRQLQVAGVLADVPKLLPVVHNRGTTVTVKDLYFNVPARRGNLKSIATEFTHIETIVREVALARADVTLSLFHDDKKRLSLSASSVGNNNNNVNDNDNDNGSRLPLSRLEQALGTSLTDNAISIVVDLSSILQPSPEHADKQATINGWLWANDNQQHPLPKLLYVNGRLVKEVLISNQLRQLANSFQLNGIGYALYFELPHHWLNINVHPSKQRIKISPLNNIMAHLSHTVRLKLKNLNISPAVLAAKPVEQDGENEIIPRDTLSIAKTPRQQVQASKQPYQLSEAKPLLKYSPDSNANNSTSNHNDDAESKALFVNNKLTLPQCLDVITRLPQSHQASLSSIVNNDHLSALPWLLFYSQAQCLLISAQDWQSSIALLCAPDLFENPESESPEARASSAMINQHLAMVTAPLSAPEFATFKVSLEQLLNTHALTIINTEQLLTLMLSSAPA